MVFASDGNGTFENNGVGRASSDSIGSLSPAQCALLSASQLAAEVGGLLGAGTIQFRPSVVWRKFPPSPHT